MCGICGEVRFDTLEASRGRVQAMVDHLSPRGPDASGLWAQNETAFGHRRLKIIDLSDNAQQPMVDPDLGLVIVFNGCIYNYAELRQELSGLGYRFFSTGDTEVVLKAWHAWGRRCVDRFHGMFAFAIRERDSGRVILARDRLGIKPLYLNQGNGWLRFASTLPALLAAGEVDTELDPVALHHYLTFHAVVPAPHTLLKGIRKLPPATIAIIDRDGQRTDHLYWTLRIGPDAADAGLPEETWRERLLEALQVAVKRRLVADVPVGVLLSGGLDSSLLVGLLSEQGQTGLNTFSIGFEAVHGEAGDEFRYSDVIARHYATEHHQIRIGAEEMFANLPQTIAAMSEPMVSHDNVGFFLLSREVARHVKVVQSGQGADEVFGGYHWYPPLLNSADPVADYARVFFDRDHGDYARLVHPRFLESDYSRAFVQRHFHQIEGSGPVDKALHLDTTVMLIDDPVKRVDSMTMAWGLEARVPFLDHELVELAGRIPAELKLRHDGKGILKEVARRIIPAEVIDRPKGYFPVPALKYIQGPFLELVRGALDNDRARQRELFQADQVAALLREPKAHITPLGGSKLWQLALLELWLQTHGL